MIRDLWYKHAVIYYLDVSTFLDANGDGIGDFEGLMRRIEYFHSLGVDVLWLAPFQPSPNRDNGYDISDYYGVDPRHGSLGDFVEFIHAAHNRGIKVIIDLVVNHTSDEHRWFQEARKDKDSPYRDWYIWADEPPGHWDLDPAFPGVVQDTWTRDEKAESYFLHRFFPFQPDLNLDNPEVRTEIQRIMGLWLELGIAGFRVDAVPFLIESFDFERGSMTSTFDYLHEMRDFLQWRQGNAILLGEVNVHPENTTEYFGREDEALHTIFNFHVNQHLFYALATGEVGTLAEALRATQSIPAQAQWAHFLRNHDELSLDQLTEEQRARVYAAFGPEEEMRIYGRGIRRRLASMLSDRRKIELANSILFALPGTPVLYYGDEIGMGEELSLSGRDPVRTPMQWADEPQAGFSVAEQLTRPVVADGPYSYHNVNVQDQRRDPDSLFNWMAHMIRLRQESPEIGWGSWEIIETDSPSVLILRYDWQGTSLLTIHNFADQPQTICFKPEAEDGDTLVDLIEPRQSHAGDDGYHRMTIDPYGYQWYRVGGLRYRLSRPRD